MCAIILFSVGSREGVESVGGMYMIAIFIVCLLIAIVIICSFTLVCRLVAFEFLCICKGMSLCIYVRSLPSPLVCRSCLRGVHPGKRG